jgi:hypothetical protein
MIQRIIGCNKGYGEYYAHPDFYEMLAEADGVPR